jgi:hypothetical protein
MAMLRLKSCPRCRGDIIVDRDFDGWYEQCLQCGYQHYLESLAEAKPPAKKDQKVPVAVTRRR